MRKDNVIITWGVLLIGLKKSWLTSNEVVKLVNENSTILACNEDLLVEFNINDGDKDILIDLLEGMEEANEELAIKYWQKSVLLAIKQSQKPVEDKLKDIALQWSRFDYPDDWRDFIHYMPNENSNSSSDVYQVFLNYLKQNW